ncbi:chemotaxis protein CheW [Radicibacter daui]|uniref:chemotaxis protein CheW n=1 Tax=Radicibacter daui TaxID=3064829 RepID=UPI004046DEC0
MLAGGQARHDGEGRLYLLFQLGADRYALDSRAISEVLPRRTLKRLPEAPAWVAGVLEHRGGLVPVIDLAARVSGNAARQQTSTRLVIVQYPVTAQPQDYRLLGLLLERATETKWLPDAGFEAYGLDRGSADYLGPIQKDDQLIQRVEVAGLLPDDVRAMLFAPSDPGGAAA